LYLVVCIKQLSDVVVCKTNQVAHWVGKENQAPFRLQQTARNLCLILDAPPFELNKRADLLKLCAGMLKSDRNGAQGLWGTWGSNSDDRLGIIESIVNTWQHLIYSVLTPPTMYLKATRYEHYLLSVGDSLRIREDPDGHFCMRKPHAGVFGNAIEVCEFVCVSNENRWCVCVIRSQSERMTRNLPLKRKNLSTCRG
jgi:hypothetical protein